MKKVKLRILMMLMAMMAVMSLIGCEKRDNDQEQKRTTSAKVEKTNKKEEQEEESEEWEEEYEEQEESDLYALYDQYLEEEAPLLLSDYEQGEYGFYDVDGDDVDELILREPGYLYIIQYRDGELVNVYQEGVYSDLLENGMVRYYRPGTAPEHENYALILSILLYTFFSRMFDLCCLLQRSIVLLPLNHRRQSAVSRTDPPVIPIADEVSPDESF